MTRELFYTAVTRAKKKVRWSAQASVRGRPAAGAAGERVEPAAGCGSQRRRGRDRSSEPKLDGQISASGCTPAP